MGVAYTGRFKIIFSLLVMTILGLVTYSLWYESTWLAPNTKQRMENNATVGPASLSLFYTGHHSGGSTSLAKYDTLVQEYGIIRRPKVNNTMRNLLTEQDSDQNIDTGQRSTIYTVRKDEEPGHSLGQTTTNISTLHHPQSLGQDQISHDPIRGYIVVLNIYEQQTMASGNLLQFQCWAKFLNLVVVKPFMQDSSLETPLDETNQARKLRMEDTFDMQNWNQYAQDAGYAPLVEWEEFVKSAPRKLIVVQTRFPTLTRVRAIRDQGYPFPHPPTSERLYAQGCKFKLLQSKGMHLLKKKGFVVVRTVCLNFRSGDELSLKQLQEHILDKYKDDKLSIVIDEWRGLGENQRMPIQEKICLEENNYKEHTKPSARIVRDTEAYIKRYLQHSDTGGSNTSNYIAVMARYEMTGLTKRVDDKYDQFAIIPYCLQATYQRMEEMKIKTNMSKVFLSMDIGKYGSDSFRNKKYFGHLKSMEDFVGKVYQGGFTVRDWERTFESITHTQDSGYIAMLQLVMVTRAKCILFVGGGTFQRHALHLYQDLHPDPDDRCVTIIERCTSPYRPVEK